MELKKEVVEALAEARDNLGLCLEGGRERGYVYKLRGLIGRKCYVAALVKPDGQTLEIVGVWDRKGRPTWIAPRVISSEGLYHLLERADGSVRSGSWRGRSVGENE